MVRKHRNALVILLLMAAVLPLSAQAPSHSDLTAIYQIKDEGFNHSQVMEIMSYLTDVYGPRLTNSPNIKQAAEWTTSKMKEWQLANVHLEPWGPFGKGWANERFSLQAISPRPFPLIAYAKAWTPGTNGVVTAEAVWAPIQKEEDIEKYRGKLKGKFVLTAQQPEIPVRSEAQFHRLTDAELNEEATQPVPTARAEDRFARFRAQRELNEKIQKFLVEEGVAVWLEPSQGDDGTAFVQSGGGRDPKDPPAPPRVAVASENYGRLVRMLEKKVPLTLQADIQNKFYEDDLNSFNIIGEIPGSEKSKADEVVMIGAHFDSWHAGTGATDNGAGSGVMLEAMRILKATGVRLRRTVRIGLWTGEEQGLLGSRAYVKQHFADWEPDAAPDKEKIKVLPEHAKLDAYYNVDNGSGKIRGIYLQGNEAIAPLFSQWMEPFHNLGMTTLTIRNTGGTDHLAFDAVGLPGFQFVQDPLDYDTRTHHSNMDVYERIQEPDMKQMAVIVASFVYLTVNRDEMVPRKPLPKTRGIVRGLFGALQTGKVSRPEVPKILEPPVGEEVLLSAHAKGVQIYACQAGADQKPAWVLKGPDAELTDAAGKTIAHHFAGPTWKHADGSEVTGKKVKEQDAPKANAIPWLLLTAASHTGEGVFRRVTSIQRIRTEGGLAPEANTCDSSANGKEARRAYEADYYFYVSAAN